jgi:flagellar hook-associated protein 1 FlgK
MASLFTIGNSALAASYASMRTTGHNIANAGTEGFSRQQVELETAGSTFSGGGYFGRGVQIATVSRSHDQFLAREVVLSQAIAEADRTRADNLRRLETIFATGQAGIGYKAGELLNAFADVAARPQDTSSRQVVLGRAADLVNAFRMAAEEVETVQASINVDLVNIAGEVSALAKQVADINRKVVASQGQGQPINDLLDQRDQLIRSMSGSIGITTIASDDGSINVFVGGGQMLVLGTEANALEVVADRMDPTRSALNLKTVGGTVELPSELITTGRIGGLFRVQSDDLVVARSLLGQMAAALAERVNDQQALGLDLSGTDGKAIFGVGEPEVRASSLNARDASGVPVASYLDVNGVRRPSVQITVVDATRLRAVEYELQPAASGVAGDYTLTSLPDGSTQTIQSGAIVDGFQFDIVGPAPTPKDRFLLQPVGVAARYMSRELDDPRGIAAAAPVIAMLDPANTGTATANSLRPVSSDPTQAVHGARITFGAPTGTGGMNYAWEQLDTLGATVAAGAGVWNPGEPISTTTWGVSQRVQWDLRLTGVPATGDIFNIAPTTVFAPNNGNAEALLALRDERFVGRDATGISGANVTDAWARTIADIGLRVQTSRSAAETSGIVAERAELSLKATSGVNLDEEAARLMQFQQSYQAAAKVLQVAQSIFDTLLQTAAR